jgi:hypothetical protein
MKAGEGISQSTGPRRIARDAGDYPELLRSRLEGRSTYSGSAATNI